MSRDEIQDLILFMDEETDRIISSEKETQDFLVELGTHDENGDLTPEYSRAYKL